MANLVDTGSIAYWPVVQLGVMKRFRRHLIGLWIAVLATAATADEATLSIADVQGMPRSELSGRPVLLTGGVVTWIQLPCRSRMTIQDGSRGMWLTTIKPWPKSPDVWRGSADTLEAIELGDVLEIDGLLDPGGFAPKVFARNLRVVGRAALPEPIPMDDERFFSGADECCRIAVSGVVQGFRGRDDHWLLLLESGTRTFEAQIPNAGFPDPASRLVDATVNLVGVTIAAFNARGELLHPRVVVMHPDDVTVITPPPCPPFEARFVPLANLAKFTSAPVAGHRVRSKGTVNYVFPGGFYLQDGPTGIRVETVPGVAVAVNDRVEVTGFLDRRRHAAGIHNAAARVIGQGTSHPPFEISPAEVRERFRDARLGGTAATPGDYDGCLITFPARLTEIEKTPNGGLFLLAAEGVETRIRARMDVTTFASLATIRPDSQVQVTGLLQFETSTPKSIWSELQIEQFVLGIRSVADVTVLAAPSWWTKRRLGMLAVALATVVAGTLAWVGLLRRQVKAQSVRIAHELQTRRNSALEFQASLRERSRLAANLHDTILQTLAGALLQLDVCRHSMPEHDSEEATDQLGVAKRMVRHAATDLRSSVWALRTQPMTGRSFSESLQAVVQRFSTSQRERVTLHAEDEPFPLPRFVAGNLLLVAQEAIRNACSHAGASQVMVSLKHEPGSRTVMVTVEDDGSGFDVDKAAGPEQGHFGLQGMRERIDALAGSLVITSEPGRGTRVTAQVTVRAHDVEMEVSSFGEGVHAAESGG